MEKTTSKRGAQYLPCSIVDECYYLWDALIGQAPVFYLVFSVKGKIDQKKMESALDASLVIHNKLKYLLTNSAPSWKRWFRLFWEPHDVSGLDVLKILSPQDLKINLNQESHYFLKIIHKYKIDIFKEAGVKVFLINRKEDNLLFFAFHHAVTDGRGAANFIETFILEYNRIYFNKQIKRQRIIEFTYFDKKLFPTWRQGIKIIRALFYVLRHQLKSLRFPLVKLIPKTESPDKKRMVVIRRIEGEEINKIKALAKRRSILFTDLLLAGIYFTVKKWNNRWGGNESGRISFYSAVGLRDGENKSLGNYVSGMVMNFFTKDNPDKEEVLKNIAQERNFLIDNQAYTIPLILLSIFKLIPIRFRIKALKWGFRKKRSGKNHALATIRITNLGVLDLNHLSNDKDSFLGDARLDSVFFSPAILNEVPLIMFLTCNNNMYVSLSVLSSIFSYKTSNDFLDLFLKELSEF